MRVFACLCLLAVSLAACTGSQPPTITLIPSITSNITQTRNPTTPAPTGTSVQVPTLPPEWTTVPVITLEATIAPPTQTFTATIDPNPTLLSQPTLTACATFGVDFERTGLTFTIGSDPTIYWHQAQGALTYRIAVRDAQSRLLFSSTMGGTSFELDGRLFELGSSYSWEVRPLDVNGRQMCVSRGAILTAVVG